MWVGRATGGAEATRLLLRVVPCLLPEKRSATAVEAEVGDVVGGTAAGVAGPTVTRTGTTMIAAGE